MSKGLRLVDVVDVDDVELGAPLDRRAQDVAADAPEAVDRDASHETSLEWGYIGCGIRSVKRGPAATQAQKTQRAPRRGARCPAAGGRPSGLLGSSLHRLAPLLLQILGDELDQLGREREQLAWGVSARAKLLVEGPGQDAGPCGPIQRDGARAVGHWSLRGELFRHGAPRLREAAALPGCNLPAEFTIPDISTTYAWQCKQAAGCLPASGGAGALDCGRRAALDPRHADGRAEGLAPPAVVDGRVDARRPRLRGVDPGTRPAGRQARRSTATRSRARHRPIAGRRSRMAKATWEGRECDVRVDTDLESNWSVSILSGEFDPVSLIQRPAAPVIIKVRAKTRWLALDQGLRSLKAQGKIADFTLEPRPAEEIAAEEAEKAKKKGGVAKVEAEEEA